MEYQYPKFTKEMKKTHTILIPNMAVTQFRLLKYALEHEGYKCEILGNCGSAVAQLGLKYVHNDTCYPALLVIGQFIDALNSGKYDLDRTALLITQTGGGCRASNYIHLLRKALVKAGYPQIPVASLNFSGLEKDSGFQMDLPLLRQAVACIFYGDMLCALRNQIAPYEDHPGDADRLVDVWIGRIGRALLAGKGYTAREMKHTFPLIAREFAVIPRTKTPKVKVGVVGEIYVKYSPLGNNDLQKFLEGEGCEVNFPGLMGFVQYCIFNMGEDHVLYGGSGTVKFGADRLLDWLDGIERAMLKAISNAGFYAPGPFKELIEKADKYKKMRMIGINGQNSRKGNDDNAVIVPDFSFDFKTAPMLFIHGDADVYSPMGSVKVWEKMRSMGIQSELHTLALRNHCFQRSASPGTGSYTWLDRIADFLRAQKRL